MELEVNEVLPHLNQIPSNQETVELWVAGMVEWLNASYGKERLERLRSFVITYIADAVNRRMAKPDTMLISESAGPFRAQWSERSATAGMFLPEEIADLNRVLGVGGARSYRTAAPGRFMLKGGVYDGLSGY